MKIIGVNIKKLRENGNITLRELAKKLHVSASFLSQIETDKASPSLVTLKKIADALNTTVGALLGEEQGGPCAPVLRASERKSVQRIGNGISIYLLTLPNPNNQMETLLFKLREKANSGDTMYRHFGQEFVYVLKGGLELTLNDKKHVLNTGDTAYFNSNTPHSFRNVYKGETEALWVITPPTF